MAGQGTIVATGSIAYPVGLGSIGAMIGAEKVMTMTSTYDHRIIQGAESGRFLQLVEGYLQGEHGFYDGVFAVAGVELGPARRRRRPAAAAAAARRRRRPPPAADGALDEELLQAVQAATSLLKAHRTHGHLAARLDPLGTEPEGDPALDPEPSGSPPRSWPGSRRASCACTSPAPRWPTRSRTCARPTAARSPTRSSTSHPPPARLAAREDRVAASSASS